MSKVYVAKYEVKVVPMTRLEYNEFRGWKLPDDEDGTDKGFLIEHEDNTHINWKPEDVFHRLYAER